MTLACEKATAKYPEGRTGRVAGYQAHWRAGEEPCQPCLAAQRQAGKDRWADLSEVQRQERREKNRLERARYCANNSAHVRALAHRRIAANRAVIQAAKDVPCADCGVAYPYYVMQFDHLGDKAFNIGIEGPTRSRAVLLVEIAKCDVVCANCHAERSFQRLQQKNRPHQGVCECCAPLDPIGAEAS